MKVRIFSLAIIVLANLSCFASDDRFEKITTIRISSKFTDSLGVKKSEETQYDNSFGRGSIFDYVDTSDWQVHIAEKMRTFYNSITEIGVNQNPILVCFGIENVCSFLQHIFFSGNVESVTEKVFLNTEDLKRQFGDLRTGQNPLFSKEQSQALIHQSASLQKSRTLVRRAFIDKEEPTDYARKRTLEYLVKTAFPSIFWEEDQGDFFCVPCASGPQKL